MQGGLKPLKVPHWQRLCPDATKNNLKFSNKRAPKVCKTVQNFIQIFRFTLKRQTALLLHSKLKRFPDKQNLHLRQTVIS